MGVISNEHVEVHELLLGLRQTCRVRPLQAAGPDCNQVAPETSLPSLLPASPNDRNALQLA
eukprot:3217102-Pyramimonas_sp.AAC.1